MQESWLFFKLDLMADGKRRRGHIYDSFMLGLVRARASKPLTEREKVNVDVSNAVSFFMWS